MLNYVLIYSKDECPWCVKARDFLQEKNISNIAELKVGYDLSVKDFREIAASNGRKSTVPLMFYRSDSSGEWKVLGGYEDLVSHFKTTK